MLRSLLVAGSFIAVVALAGFGHRERVGTDFTDRQIFEGVVFGSGPVATLIPEARDHLRPELYVNGPHALAELAGTRARIIDAIEHAHPGFLAEFGKAARSGDPSQVQAMLSRGMDAVAEVTAARRSLPRDGNIPVARDGNIPVQKVQPAWALLSSRLFSEQLANSVAVTFDAH